MTKEINEEKVLADADVRKLVLARLSVLSRDTVISLGSAGSFSRDELLHKVEQGDAIGEKLAEIQLEWLRSFKGESHL